MSKVNNISTIRSSHRNKKAPVNSKSLLIFAFLFPFVGLVYSYLKRNQVWMKNIFWIACAYSGFVFIFNPIGGTDNDYVRYAEDFRNITQLNLSFSQIINSAYTTGIFRDLFYPLLMYVLSFISDDPRLFFGVFALIFGFFYSRNIWFVIERIPARYNGFVSILLVYFILVVPFWGLVRIWLAIHIFVYGAIPFIFKKDKTKIIWVFASILFHYTMIFPVLVFIGYLFIPKNQNVLFIFFVVTLLINEIDFGTVRNIVSSAFPFMERAVETYANEDYAEIRASMEYAWHVVLANNIEKYSIIILVFYSFFNHKSNFKIDSSIVNLFSFSLFMYGFANIFALIPSGGRFIYLSQLFMIPSILFLILNTKRIYQSFLYKPLMLMLIFPILFKIRVGLDYYGISFFIGNFFTAIFLNDNVPLIDFIK